MDGPFPINCFSPALLAALVLPAILLVSPSSFAQADDLQGTGIANASIYSTSDAATVTLEAFVGHERAAGVTVGLVETEDDAKFHRAPPGHFEDASLRVVGDEGAEYANAIVPPSEPDGHTFDLVLRGAPGTTVELHRSEMDAFAGQEMVLVEPETGRRHDLRSNSAVTVPIEAGDGETPLQLLVGSESYVQGETPVDELAPPYPNPASGTVTIEYALSEETNVRLAVYNSLGQKVDMLKSASQPAGRHHVQWSTHHLSSGTYFLRLKANGYTTTRQATVAR